MRIIEIESWALRLLSAVQAGHRIEDARVELKASFPDPIKAARRIAAHANSSFSEPILWLIGVNENSGVCGVKSEELADWWPQVISAFDGAYPSMKDVVVSSNGAHVRCLYFETDRAPFLVKNSTGQGAIQREIPWREGTATRTATREEVIRMLQPDLPLPEFEILGGSISAVESHLSSKDALRVTAKFKTYLIPKTETALVIPFHRCSARLVEGTQVLYNEHIFSR